MKKIIAACLFFAMAFAFALSPAEQPAGAAMPLKVKVLLLPKFEVGEMSGDFPGEAQHYYEQYLTGRRNIPFQTAPAP